METGGDKRAAKKRRRSGPSGAGKGKPAANGTAGSADKKRGGSKPSKGPKTGGSKGKGGGGKGGGGKGFRKPNKFSKGKGRGAKKPVVLTKEQKKVRACSVVLCVVLCCAVCEP